VADDPINSKGELTTVQRGAIGDFVRRCWSTDPAMLDLDRMEVLLTVTTDGAGVVRRAVVAQDDVARVNSNPRLKIMAQRAVRAVLDPNCADLPLPQQMLAGPPRSMTGLGDGVDAPQRHLRAKVMVSNRHLKEASMEQANTIGLDIAKHVFQAHGAGPAGEVLFRKRVTRAKLLGFFTARAPCVVAMEACAGSHYWAREISKLGHTVRLIPPAYVKPFVKRQKNDAADAEAICEAAQRPSMPFVPVKTEDQQANGVVFRARDLLVHQRTQCINALRGHLSEYGYVFPQGITHRWRL
jgi:hypothetical protein